MIRGCSNHGCAVKGATPGMHTNGICKCVGSARASFAGYEIVVCGGRVGPEMSMSECIIIMRWLKGSGLRDILALERAKGVEG